jgi:hypothetical protein
MARSRTASWPIFLSPEERQTLARWQRATTSAAGRARRGKIILRLAAGSSQAGAAPAVGVHRTVVRHGATRFLVQRLDGLTDAPGRGAKGGCSPSGGEPHRAPGLRTPGAAGASPLPGGVCRTGAPAHRGGSGDSHRGAHRTPDAGGTSTQTLAPSGVALSAAAAGRRLRSHHRRGDRPLYPAPGPRGAGAACGREDCPPAATAPGADPASATAAHAEPRRA